MKNDRKTRAWRVWFLLGGISALSSVALINPWGIFREPFRTQTILFRDKADTDHRVEYQMQDVGALGFNKQIVEVRPFLFVFETSIPFDSTAHSSTDWIRVDEEVNELGIRYP